LDFVYCKLIFATLQNRLFADFIKSLKPTVIQENVVSKALGEDISGIYFSESKLKHDSEVVLTL
jgi:hypothetical protein